MTVIGRREDCDLRIPLSDVSRKHCRLILDGEAMKVEDLGSSNGTYRNGERVQQTEVAAGDTLQIGPVVFVVQVDGYPADEELKPVVAGPAEQDTKTPAVASASASASGDEEDAIDLESSAAGASATAGEFDPMEALESAEGSAFDFQIDESQHGEQSPVDSAQSAVDADLEGSGH